VARQTVRKKHPSKKPQQTRERGLAFERYQVDLRGAQYFVFDTHTHTTMGGPYPDRIRAQQQADSLNRNLGW
jgi:hypothetical protein